MPHLEGDQCAPDGARFAIIPSRWKPRITDTLVALETGLPVINGTLAVERFEDAAARVGGSHGNKGEEAALVVTEMANLQHKLRQQGSGQ